MNEKPSSTWRDVLWSCAHEDRLLREACTRGEVDWEEVAAVDAAHADVLDELVRELGWSPLFSDGEKTANSVWVVVQHANRRPKFQTRALTEWKALRPLVPEWQIAFLEDRIALLEGRPQLFGTQFQKRSDGSWAPWPIAAPTIRELDGRRLEVGLPPFSDHYKAITGSHWPEDGQLPVAA